MMHPLVQKFTRALRARDMSPGVIARKVARNATAIVRASVVLRRFDHVGARPRAFGSVHVRNAGVLAAGDDLAVGGRFGAVVLACGDGATLMLGDRVTINYGSYLGAACEVVLDDDVMIGPYCVIGDSDGPPRAGGKGALDRGKAIFIGANVWLAARVVVRPGAHIGAGAVISAGSVVEGDIPPNAIASGCPARVLRVHDGRGEPGRDDGSSIAKLRRR